MTAKPTAAALGTVPFALPTVPLAAHQQQQQQQQMQRQQLEEAAAAADGKKAPAFVRRLWEALSDHANSPIIAWNSDSSFTILDPSEFSAKVLPKMLKFANYTIFLRQLNEYGFEKVSAGKETYRHDRFRRGYPNMLKLIHRRKRTAEHAAATATAAAAAAAAAAAGFSSAAGEQPASIQSLVMQLAMLQIQAEESRAMVEAVRQEVLNSQQRQNALQDLTHRLAASAGAAGVAAVSGECCDPLGPPVSASADALSQHSSYSSYGDSSSDVSSVDSSYAPFSGGFPAPQPGQPLVTLPPPANPAAAAAVAAAAAALSVHVKAGTAPTPQQQPQQQQQPPRSQQPLQQPMPPGFNTLGMPSPGTNALGTPSPSQQGVSPLTQEGQGFPPSAFGDVLDDIPAAPMAELQDATFDEAERQYWEQYLDPPHI